MNKHNNSCWYEIFALSTLQVVFPLEFRNLRLSDRPDLMDFDSNFGVEVVHPVDEKHEMFNSYYYNYLFGKTIDQISPKGLEKFKSNSYDIVFDSQDNTVSSYKSPYKPFDIQFVFCAIDKKMEKLNANLYECSSNISLFLEMAMYSSEIADYSVAKRILSYVKTIEQNYSLSYKEIFFDCIMKLYRIDIKNEKIIEIDTFELIDSIQLKYEEIKIKEGWEQL